MEDAAIVATHLMLGAYNAGVDSCWLNNFNPEELKRDLGLPEEEEILMLLDLGYASENAKPLVNHFSRKELTETVQWR
ncbi:nitroreductase family protein [Laedolimicola ammoniilytica]|uniref:nitroreductase family protein n=1 Tax=Laedolimicola ammoniilytica TaxID=2981771 RepID=UPI002F412008